VTKKRTRQNEHGANIESSESQDSAPQGRRDNDGLHRRGDVWWFSLRIGDKRRFFSTKSRDYQEARKVRAHAIKAQLENRLPTDLAKWRFEQLAAQVLEDRKPHLAENTIRLEKERSGPLLKHFSGRRVSEIDNAAIRAYQASRSKLVNPRTVNLETKLLRQILKAAKVWGMLADDYKPLKEDRRGPGRALEENQEKILFETARLRPGWDAAFFAALAAANTTMRGVELRHLRLQDVNLMDREVSIQRSKGNTAGVRRIPLNDAALWAFARLLERANAFGSIEAQHFLFPRFNYRVKTPGHGTGHDPSRPQKGWRTAWRALIKETARRAGREAGGKALQDGRGLRATINAWKSAAAPFRGLRFHDLRHLAVTKLAESEASDQTIMSIAGHLNRAMLEHYSHIRAAAKRKAVEAMRSYVPEEATPALPKRVQ
jgi:integrase